MKAKTVECTICNDIAIAILQPLLDQGYNPAVVGGFLRMHLFGGETSDVDIAVLCGPTDLDDLEYLLNSIGATTCHRKSSNPYEGKTGFLGDWRLGLINIIAYDSGVFSNFEELVGTFDLNINALYILPYGEVEHPYIPDVLAKPIVVQQLKDTSGMHSVSNAQRYSRFKRMFPDMDWSQTKEVSEDQLGDLL